MEELAHFTDSGSQYDELSPIILPPEFLDKFSSTSDANLYFFALVQKVTHWFFNVPRYLLISDNVACLATTDTGEASWYAPVSWMKALHICKSDLSIGIELRDDYQLDQLPFLSPVASVTSQCGDSGSHLFSPNTSVASRLSMCPSPPPAASRYRPIFTDLVIRAAHLQQLEQILELLCVIHSYRSTEDGMTCPPLAVLDDYKSVTEVTQQLVLRPDGIRMKPPRRLLCKPSSRSIWTSSCSVSSPLSEQGKSFPRLFPPLRDLSSSPLSMGREESEENKKTHDGTAV